MKQLRQLAWILVFSLLGEVCHRLIPFPIPASIYGMVLLFLALFTRLLKVEAVKETGNFLVSLFPMLFVVSTVGLLGCWELIRDKLWLLAVLILVTTVLTFGISGLVSRLFSRKEASHE